MLPYGNMNRVYIVLFLLFNSCGSLAKVKTPPVTQAPPRGSSGSLGKNIDELDSALNKSLTRVDKIIADLGGK